MISRKADAWPLTATARAAGGRRVSLVVRFDFIQACGPCPRNCTLDFHLLNRRYRCRHVGKQVFGGGFRLCRLSHKGLLRLEHCSAIYDLSLPIQPLHCQFPAGCLYRHCGKRLVLLGCSLELLLLPQIKKSTCMELLSPVFFFRAKSLQPQPKC